MPVLQWGRVDVWEEVQHSASWLAFWGGGPNKHAHEWFGLQGSTGDISGELIEDIRQAVHRRPDAMVTRFQAIGTPEMVKQRFEAYRSAGVTTLKLGLDNKPLGSERFELLEQIVELS